MKESGETWEELWALSLSADSSARSAGVVGTLVAPPRAITKVLVLLSVEREKGKGEN